MNRRNRPEGLYKTCISPYTYYIWGNIGREKNGGTKTRFPLNREPLPKVGRVVDGTQGTSGVVSHLRPDRIPTNSPSYKGSCLFVFYGSGGIPPNEIILYSSILS